MNGMNGRPQETEILSFDQDLRHAFTPLSQRLERGVEGIDKVIEILRLRISLEAEFAKGIEKIIQMCDFASEETGTMREALDAIKADMKNEIRTRAEFVNSLNEDVYAPLIQTKDLYNARNIKYAQDTKANIKSLRQEQSKWLKMKGKFDKATKEAQEARSALLNAQSNKIASSQQVMKLGTRVNNTMKAQQQLQEKYDSHKVDWNHEQLKFDNTMTAVLQGMESNEEARLNALGDSLRKWAVFITNLTANRNYDVRSLAEAMSQIDVKQDLQNFMRTTLGRNPIKSNDSMSPRSVYRFGDGSRIDEPSTSLRSSSLSFGQAKRRRSLSKNDIKKFVTRKKNSIDLSHTSNNSNNGSRRGSIGSSNNQNGYIVNSNGNVNSINISNHSNSSINSNNSNSQSNQNHTREDSLSKKSLSDMLRGNRLFRSGSTPDRRKSPNNSNYGSKNHSREPSFVGNNNGNNSIETGAKSVPENETVLPMPTEMLANKERLVEPPPQPRNSISKSKSSCDDPEIDGAFDLDDNTIKKKYNDMSSNNKRNNNGNDSNNQKSSLDSRKETTENELNVKEKESLRVKSIESDVKRRNHKIINSFARKQMKKPVKKNETKANSNFDSNKNGNENANANGTKRRNSSHYVPFAPPSVKAPTPPAEPREPIASSISTIPTTTTTLLTTQSVELTSTTTKTKTITTTSQAQQWNNARKSNEGSRESTPTLSGDSDIRFSNDLDTSNNQVSLMRRKDQSPPASARNSLAHMSSLMKMSTKPKELNQPSIPEINSLEESNNNNNNTSNSNADN